jgi:hypothetical protein
MKETKAPVSRRALFQRVNRKLAKEGLALKKTSGQRARIDLGEYFLIDTKRNTAVERHIDLAKFATKHGVLEPWERLDQ